MQNNLGLIRHPNHPDGVALVVPANSGVDKEGSRFLALGLKVEVVVGSLDFQEGIVHDFLHLLLELGNNIHGKEGPVELPPWNSS